MSGFSNVLGEVTGAGDSRVVAAPPAALGAADFEDELSDGNPLGRVEIPKTPSRIKRNNGCDLRSSIFSTSKRLGIRARSSRGHKRRNGYETKPREVNGSRSDG